MRIIIDTNNTDIDYYLNWIQGISIRNNHLNLMGQDVQDFVYDRKEYYDITTDNLNIDLSNILINELNIINHHDKDLDFWYKYIKEKKYIKIYQTNDLLVCTSKLIYKINIYLNKDKITKTLFNYDQILTPNGLQVYHWDKNICVQDSLEYAKYLDYKWTKMQSQVYNLILSFYKDEDKQLFLKLFFSFDYQEFYNYFCKNWESLLNFYDYEYLDKDSYVYFFYPAKKFHYFEELNKLADQIGNKCYYPIYLVHDNWLIENEYGFITIENNKRLGIHLDKCNYKTIELFIPIELFNRVQKLNLKYEKYNDVYYKVITNNPVDIYIIMEYMRLIINKILKTGYSLIPDEGIINVQNN